MEPMTPQEREAWIKRGFPAAILDEFETLLSARQTSDPSLPPTDETKAREIRIADLHRYLSQLDPLAPDVYILALPLTQEQRKKVRTLACQTVASLYGLIKVESARERLDIYLGVGTVDKIEPVVYSMLTEEQRKFFADAAANPKPPFKTGALLPEEQR